MPACGLHLRRHPSFWRGRSAGHRARTGNGPGTGLLADAAVGKARWRRLLRDLAAVPLITRPAGWELRNGRVEASVELAPGQAYTLMQPAGPRGGMLPRAHAIRSWASPTWSSGTTTTGSWPPRRWSPGAPAASPPFPLAAAAVEARPLSASRSAAQTSSKCSGWWGGP